MARPEFAPGDNIAATCHVCEVDVVEPLTGPFDPAVVEAAVQKVSGWMQAHLEQFHPELAGKADG